VIRTVLVDDHKLFCDGLERVLNDSGHFQVIEKFYNGNSLLEKVGSLQPDLLIIDVEMPNINGFDAIKRIRLNNETAKIVVLSMHEENIYSQEAYMLGADGYLNKSMESMQLIDSLQKACNGERMFAASAMTSKIESPFSDREHEILKLIGTGKTSEQIAERLKISHLTVKAHRRNMMRKLNVNNAAELISKALEMGFLYRSS
jgi:DNA-binding NarL/FixJ family response regulator